MAKNTKRIPKSLEYVLTFYDAALRSDDMAKIATACGLASPNSLAYQLENCPEIQLAWKMAQERRGSRETFSGYVFQRLSPEARKTWNEIKFWDGAESAYEKVSAILSGKAKRLRQELFIHSLCVSNFDLSTACRMTGTPRKVLDLWRRDPEFREMVEEIQWHKKNFFERALLDLVEVRHPGATIFVNRTVNRDRGYGESLEISQNQAPAFDLACLNLPVEVRLQILKAIREQKAREEKQAGPPEALDLPPLLPGGRPA